MALQGAQVLSWVAGGREQLFLSPRAAHDGKSAIRGGIPICFPQFNQRGPLVKHGFARLLPWQARAEEAQAVGNEEIRLTLRLTDTEATRAVWPHAFEALLHVQLAAAALTVRLEVCNLGDTTLAFTTALHSYLRVPDVQQVQLLGLQGRQYWDAVADTHPTQDGAVRFGAELDRVYPGGSTPLQLQRLGDSKNASDSPGQPLLHIVQTEDFRDTVVWNPGPKLCATLQDMAPDSWRHMLCVEAATVNAPVQLPPGASWQASQLLHAMPASAVGQAAAANTGASA